MNEDISRLMDGELDDDRDRARRRRAEAVRGAMATWVCYHVIGDSLRGERTASRRACRARFASALASEPTVLAPQRTRATGPRPGRGRRRRPSPRSAVVGWTAVSLTDAPPHGDREGARSRRRCARHTLRPQVVPHRLPARAPGVLAGDADPGRRALPARASAGDRRRPCARDDRCRGRDDARRRSRAARRRGARPRWPPPALALASPALRAGRAAVARARVDAAARTLNYIGTIVYQHGGARRDVAPRPPERRRRGVREARQPRRSGARGDPQQRRGALLLPGRQARPHRAAHVPQRVPVAVAASSRQSLAQFYDVQARPSAGASPASRRRRGCSSRATACATATSSGPTRRPACCSRRALVNENGEIVEQFAFTDVTIGAQDRPRHGASRRGRRRRPTGRCKQSAAGDVVTEETGWTVTQAAARLRQDHGRLPHAARQARAGRAPRVLRRAGRRQRVRRAAARGTQRTCRARRARAASTSYIAQQRRLPRHRAGRSAGRDGPADRARRSRAAEAAPHSIARALPEQP